ncbi:MAG: hypothetical protein QGF53_06730, partial [Alphaproteobacteria bacterium]|nr:hypothetical protein [Alphaproteobacteria bacterium]
MRLRAPYHRDLKMKIELAGDGSIDESLVMEAMTDEAEISASLPSVYHFGGLEFETGDDDLFNKRQFQRDCLSCHQLGNAYTRRAQSVSYWKMTIQRMHQYMGG